MRTITTHEAQDGTVTYRARYRQWGTSRKGEFKLLDRSQTFRLKSDAETFVALMGNGEPARVGEALAWLAKKQGDNAALADTFGAWFEQYVTELTGVTSRTRDDYQSMHDHHLAHLDDLPLGLLTRSHVADVVNTMERKGLSPKTIKNVIHALLAPCLDRAVDEGKIDRNPTKRVRLPDQRQVIDDEDPDEVNFLTYEEFAALHDAFPEHYRPLLDWLVGTGMRWSEATAIQKRHVDTDAGTARVRQAWKKVKGGWQLGPPKTEKGRRTVNVATAALVAAHPLLEGKKPGDFVFTTVRGKVIRHGNFYNRIWVPACERAGLSPRPSPHDLRDTHASWLLSDGIQLEAVQDQLGHEDISTTRKRYAALLPAVGVEVGRVASAAMERALANRVKEIEG